MKTSILKVIAVVVFVCVLVGFTPTLLQNTSVAWMNADSVSMRRNFYFGKRQWLADARTLVAAARYLYQATSANASNTINVVSLPPSPRIQRETSTNLMVINGTDTTILSHGSRISRAGNLIVRKRLVCSYCLPAATCETRNHVAKVIIRFPRCTTLPTNGAAMWLPTCRLTST